MSTLLVAESIFHERWRGKTAGHRLLRGLSENYRLVVGLDHSQVERFQVFLQMERLSTLVQETLSDAMPAHLRGRPVRAAQIEDLQSRGNEVSLLLDNDPTNIADALRMGVSGLLWCHASLQVPEFRPDYSSRPRPWDELVAEIHSQRYLETAPEVSG